MKMIITGGAGFIGSNFIFYMRKQHPEYDLICIYTYDFKRWRAL